MIKHFKLLALFLILLTISPNTGFSAQEEGVAASGGGATRGLASLWNRILEEDDPFFERALELRSRSGTEVHRFASRTGKTSPAKLINGEDGLPFAVEKSRKLIPNEAFAYKISRLLGLDNVARSRIIVGEDDRRRLFEEYIRWSRPESNPDSEAYALAEQYAQKGSLTGMFFPRGEVDPPLINKTSFQKRWLFVMLVRAQDSNARNIGFQVREDGTFDLTMFDNENTFSFKHGMPSYSYVPTAEMGHDEFTPEIKEIILSWDIPELVSFIKEEYIELIDDDPYKGLLGEETEYQRKLGIFREIETMLYTLQHMVGRYSLDTSIFSMEEVFWTVFNWKEEHWNNDIMKVKDGASPIPKEKELKNILFKYNKEVRELISQGEPLKGLDAFNAFYENYHEFTQFYFESLQRRFSEEGVPPVIDIREFIQFYIEQGNDTHVEDGSAATVEGLLAQSAFNFVPTGVTDET